ncbi:hypothetical protein L3X38_007867 [Prunus dulcis]|uniref:Retrovirus-related Pol polyprotein from transposon TNT 1-94-like beta-barrel domain-containing protein n=1 Tax=Prunus dulcis TaxID=3755 RepID=A0AAD4ZVL1_PRUDU|nr:hypothetical protein L3X38_007867 [Prunus dulcis]
MADGNPFASKAESSSVIAPSNLPEIEINPNQRLSSILLIEFKYLPWSRAVTLALGGRSKLGFINGSIEAPDISSPNYESWSCKDQLVMSWLLNSMERKIAEIFSYSESSHQLWETIKEMYGNKNNAARVFQLKQEITNLQQEGKPFVQLLGGLKNKWNELEVYHPHTTDAAVLLKRAEEDKKFQLLSSLDSTYEDLRNHILMNFELPSFTSVCATIQRKEEKVYKGKRPDLKCSYCNNISHVLERCQILHLELKSLKFKDNKGTQKKFQTSASKANQATASNKGLQSFSSNPAELINEFASYIQKTKGSNDSKEVSNVGKESSTALLSKFAEFLAETQNCSAKETSGTLNAFATALNVSNMHDFWVIDSGATDHMTNQLTHLHDFKKLSKSSLVSVANGKGATVIGKGKIKLLSDNIESMALYIPSFPFQLLSVGKITNSLKCLAIFSSHNVIFQDIATMKTIGEGIYLDGLY